MVLTGCEVLSLDIEMVKRILRLAKSCGLTTRIVTNAFWATTISAASLNDGRVGIYVSMLEKRGIPIEKMLEEIKMKQQKWHDGIAEYDSPSFAWLVPVVAVAFLYVGVATIAAVEVAVAADFALKVTGPSLPTKPEDEVKKRESVLREISENMGLTGEQMAEILDMARKNLQLGIGRHY